MTTLRQRPIIAVLIAALSVLGACAGGGANQPPPADGLKEATRGAAVEAPAAAVSFLDPSAALAEASALIPQDAIMVAVADVRFFLEESLAVGFGLAPEGFESEAMFEDLGALSVKRFGVDMTKTQWLVFFMTEQEVPMVIFKGRFGTPRGFAAVGGSGLKGRRIEDAPGFLVQTGDPSFLALVEDEEGAELLAQVMSGRMPSLKSRGDKSALMRVVAQVGKGALCLAAELGDGPISDELRREMPMPSYPRAGAVVFSDDLVAVAEGDGTSLRAIEAFINQGLEGILRELREGLLELDEVDPFEAAAIIIGHHLVKSVADAAKPVVEGETLRIEYKTVAGPGQASTLSGVGLFFLAGPAGFLLF